MEDDSIPDGTSTINKNDDSNRDILIPKKRGSILTKMKKYNTTMPKDMGDD